jgi:3-hydroxyisobutyrate dehydrogenase-like beta-hydroxyacid dehydrogenase
VEELRAKPIIIFMLPDLSHIEDASVALLASWSESPPAAGTAVVVMSSVSPAAVQEFHARWPLRAAETPSSSTLP